MQKLIKGILIILISVLNFNVYSQSSEAITTIIVLRHAEKINDPGNPDPGLSQEGLIRAENLAELFSEQKISAVYATPYQRTKLTVAPLAAVQEIEIKEYSPVDMNGFKEIFKENLGKTIVICGHSNTVPLLLKFFNPSGGNVILKEDDYDKVFIVSKSSTGASSTIKLNM